MSEYLLDNGTLEYAAKWIENSLIGEDDPRVRGFGESMAMSIRAAKIHPSGAEPCQECGGSGEVGGNYGSEDGMITCDRCNGKGTI